MRSVANRPLVSKSFSCWVEIAAPPEKIWALLVDVAGWAAWDSGVERVEGTVTPGATLKVYTKANPGTAFPVKVAELQAPTRMVWTGGMPLGLFKGVRTFTLTSHGDQTRFEMVEIFSGPLEPIFGRMIPDLQPSFDQFARGLKAQAEASPG